MKRVVFAVFVLLILVSACQEETGTKRLPEIDDFQTDNTEGIPGTLCKSVIPDHNRADHDRLNVVFVGYNVGKNEFVEFLPKLVDFEGTGYTTRYKAEAKTRSGSSAYSGEETTFYGLLGTEPFKSNKNKFNFWYIDEIQNLSVQRNLEKGPACSLLCRGDAEDTCGLKNTFTINMCNAGCNPKGGYFDKEEYIGPPNPVHIRVMIHEFGHLLGLQDEYTVLNGVDWPAYPNCAPSMELAEQWWGDLVGQGEGVLEVGYYNGCNLVEDNIRPTNSSLMRESGSTEIGFGPVNGRHVREVLQYFTGNYEQNIQEKNMSQIIVELKNRRS